MASRQFFPWIAKKGLELYHSRPNTLGFMVLRFIRWLYCLVIHVLTQVSDDLQPVQAYPDREGKAMGYNLKVLWFLC